jgi:hypothetical protein
VSIDRGLVSEHRDLVSEHSGLVSDHRGLVGEHSGLVTACACCRVFDRDSIYSRYCTKVQILTPEELYAGVFVLSLLATE